MIMMGIRSSVIVALGCIVLLRPAGPLVLRYEIVRLRKVPARVRRRNPGLQCRVRITQHGLSQEVETVRGVVVRASDQRLANHRETMDLVEHRDTKVPACGEHQPMVTVCVQNGRLAVASKLDESVCPGEVIHRVPLQPGVEPCLAVREVRMHLLKVHLYVVEPNGELVGIVIVNITCSDVQ